MGLRFDPVRGRGESPPGERGRCCSALLPRLPDPCGEFLRAAVLSATRPRELLRAALLLRAGDLLPLPGIRTGPDLRAPGSGTTDDVLQAVLSARAYLEHCPSWPRPSREQYEQAGTLDLYPGAVRAWQLERRLRVTFR